MRYPKELIVCDSRFCSSSAPRRCHDLVDRKLALERNQNAPIEIRELHDIGVDHCSRLSGARSRLHPAATNVTDAKRKQFLCGHNATSDRASLLLQKLAMTAHRVARWNLECGPQSIHRA